MNPQPKADGSVLSVDSPDLHHFQLCPGKRVKPESRTNLMLHIVFVLQVVKTVETLSSSRDAFIAFQAFSPRSILKSPEGTGELAICRIHPRWRAVMACEAADPSTAGATPPVAGA